MSLFSRGRQHSLYSFRLAALLAHLLDLLSEVLLLHLRQLVSVEVPGQGSLDRRSIQLPSRSVSGFWRLFDAGFHMWTSLFFPGKGRGPGFSFSCLPPVLT